jgi:hypothetical protein
LPYWVYRGVLKKKYQYYILPTKLNICRPDTFNLHSEDSLRISEFDSDIHKQLLNLKESEFFKCK